MSEPRFAEVPPDADLVLELEWDISEEQEENIRRNMAKKFPGRNIAILPKGVRLRPVVSLQWATRIERKLDALIKALGDEAADEPGLDLEGFSLPAERAAGVSLG